MASPSRHDDELVRHAAWVRNLVRGMVRDPQLAEDLAQDALEAGLRARGEPLRNPRAWLAGVVRNLVRHQARSDANRSAREQATKPPSEAPTPAELVSRAETQQAVARAVLKLPDPYRTVLLMRYFEELPPRRIAELRGVPRKTVENQLHRGLKLLRRELSGSLGSQWAAVVLPLAAGPWAAGLPLAAAPLIMQKKLTLAGLLVLIVASAVALWPDSDEPPDRLVRAAAIEATTGGAGPATSADAGTTPAVEREDVESSTPPPTAPVPVRARVIDEKTGATMPGVQVHVATDELQATEAWRGLPNDRERDSRGTILLGDAYLTDDEGIAAFEVPEHSRFLVVAHHVAASGTVEWSTELRRDEDGALNLDVPMTADVNLRVRVVDEHGSGVEGIPVANFEGDGPGRVRSLDEFVTGPDGYVDMLRLGPNVWWAHDSDSRHWVAINLPQEDPQVVFFDPYAPPEDVVELTLPPMGSVEVHLFALDGSPIQNRPSVFLSKIALEPDRRARTLDDDDAARSMRGRRNRNPENGVVRFEHVGLGFEVEVGCSFVYLGRIERVRAPGPTRPGETVRIDLRHTRAETEISGTVLMADGNPAADADLEGWLHWTSAADQPQRARLRILTNKSGAFRTPISDGPVTSILAAALLVEGQRETAGTLWYTKLDEIPAATVTPIGELHPENAPLAAGVVRRADGSPHANANVSLVLKADHGLTDGEAAAWYFSVGSLDFRTDDQGRFRIDGPTRLADFLAFEVPGSTPQVQRRPFTAGETGIVLQPEAATEVRGRLQVGPDIRKEDIRMSLRTSSGSGRGVNLRDDWSFTTPAEPDTVLTFAIQCARSAESLHEIGGIQVAPGQTHDLGTIDLTGEVRVFTVHVEDEQGERIDRAQVVTERPPGVSIPSLGLPPIRVLSRKAVPQVVVSAPGYRLAQVGLSAPEETVRLAKGIPVEVHVHDLADYGPDVTLVITAAHADPSLAKTFASPQGETGPSGAAEIFLPAAGRWTFSCSVRVALSPRGTAGSNRVGKASAEVPDDGLSTTVTLQVDTAAVEDFLRKQGISW